jgi:hypothetical protein
MVLTTPVWSPACMDADDLADWSAFNARIVGKGRSTSPCFDCLPSFADEMRPLGRCNGIPRGGDREETPMDLAKIAVPTKIDAPRGRRMAVDVSGPACDACAHEPVCALRAAIEGMASIETSAAALPGGLHLALRATIECDHYLRDRARPAPSTAAYWTPERRAAQAERVRALNAAKREAAAS